MMKQTGTTLPDCLKQQAESKQDAIALWYKQKGIWHSLTWSQYTEQVRGCAAGLRKLGIKSGDAVLLVGEASPEWLIADLAIQWLGGVSVTPYPDGCEHDIVDAARQTKPRLAVVDTHSRRQSLEALSVETIWLKSEQGLRGLSVTSLIQGAASNASDLSPTPSQNATIAFTVGAGMGCRPVILTHDAIISRASLVSQALHDGGGTSRFCQVPFAHVSERMCSAAAHLVSGGTLYFPERVDTVSIDLAEIAPNQISALAWQWDRLAHDVLLKINNAPGRTRKIFDRMLSGKQDGLLSALMRRSIRHQLGLARVHHLVCHGNSVTAQTDAFFSAIGLPLITGYGTTETCGWSLIKKGVGPWNALSGESYSITPEGEIVLTYNDKTIETGDMASMASGSLRLEGRKVASLGSGQKDIAIVKALLKSVYIEHAVLRRDSTRFDVIISADAQALGGWARQQNFAYTTFTSLIAHSEVNRFLTEHVTGIVRAQSTEPFNVHILQDPPRRENGSLTASGTLRRQRLIDGIVLDNPKSAREARHAIFG